jgi:NAD(P)-dependent dehydrogenase (short-subunit alcohol dehydrogenase family)
LKKWIAAGPPNKKSCTQRSIDEADESKVMREDALKVSLVTGAASGLGRAVALAFAARGDCIALCDRDASGLETTVSMIKTAGGSVVALPCDTTGAEGAASIVAAAVDCFGGLDYAVNNAGVEGDRARTGEYDFDEWRRVLGVNLDGTFLCMKAEIAAMLPRGGGAIVNVGSTASLGGAAGMPAYTASKHGLLGLTRAAALDYADRGIRINALCPGSFRTPMSERLFGADMSSTALKTPMQRLGSLEEIAAAVLFLCSGASTFITGAALPVEGGRLSRCI